MAYLTYFTLARISGKVSNKCLDRELVDITEEYEKVSQQLFCYFWLNPRI